jgi:sugar lactone lactonase YvrE
MKNLIRITVCCEAIMLISIGAQAQNLFVSDYSSGNIYEFASDGTQSVFATGLTKPEGLAFNIEDDLFVASQTGGTITEITPSGVQSTFSSGLNSPSGLAVHGSDDLYVASQTGNNITEITSIGTKSTFVTGLNDPNGIAFYNNNFFEADTGSGDIYEIPVVGIHTKITFASGLSSPVGLAFNSAGDLFVSAGNSIYEYTGGTKSTFASGLDGPTAMTFNSAGDLLVGSTSGNIYEFAPDGTESTFATGAGDVLGLAIESAPEPSVLSLLALGSATAGLILAGKNGMKAALPKKLPEPTAVGARRSAVVVHAK